MRYRLLGIKYTYTNGYTYSICCTATTTTRTTKIWRKFRVLNEAIATTAATVYRWWWWCCCLYIVLFFFFFRIIFTRARASGGRKRRRRVSISNWYKQTVRTYRHSKRNFFKTKYGIAKWNRERAREVNIMPNSQPARKHRATKHKKEMYS